MGISAGGQGGRKSDINVTPLVDICLVLLIIFLVTMPIMLKQITVEIPRKLEADEVQVATGTTISLCVFAVDGTVLIDESGAKSKIARTDLAKTLRPKIDAIKNERVVFVDFDEALKYGDVVSVMDTVKGMGKDASGNETNPVKIALKEPHAECKTLEQAE